MRNFRDYYAILGVEQSATSEEIKRSFRRLARRYHPDMNPGDKSAEDKFKDINEAYEVLSDETRRDQYNQFIQFWKKNSGKRNPFRRNGQAPQDLDPKDYPDFNRFVEELLNRQAATGGAKTGSPRGRTATASASRTANPRVNVKDPEAFRQRRTKTEYSVRDRTGTKPPERPKDIEARLSLPLEKAYRGGRERIRLEDGRSLEVDMPPGILDGQRIRLRGQGMNGGDLYLKMTVDPHPVFEVQGADVFCRVPLTPAEAILGGLVEVPTLDGLVKMNVPKGVKSGQRLRLANKGYPRNSESRGDQLVEIQIALPPEVSEEEAALYEKIRQIETFKPRQDLFANPI
ncbi:J domain-containing protein [Spirulina sp. CS-785/01]|uniref:J domain-containing protein n=1 Tax=Spirulina sp. CS-785/01 TaxID=3021716 RepID=UPI00232C5B6E|nr:J domain-containing protein [Spirulina sp. CS-785/01]MDB9313287.1 J domain-containing protein [Spirulina sp. CS-785/01]